MFEFDENLEKLYAECTPFDESELGNGPDHARIRRELQAVRAFLERREPHIMACIDQYLDHYLDLVDLECRHYFRESYRLGLNKVIQFSSISRSSTDNPS